MSTITLTDYPEEVLKWMRHKEDQHPSYHKASPQLSMRGSLVDFIRRVCESLKLSVLTTHLGVHLLDRFMDAHNISNNQLRLSALTVIFLAAKFEEKDANIPRISQLNAFADGRYSLHIFNRMETFMLNFFDWNVGTVTPAHFVEFFLMYGITPEDYSDADQVAYPSLIHRKLWFSTQHYLDISLQDTTFLQWKCSKVAAACMVCGRLHTRLLPTWPPTLEITTGYSLNSLSTLIDALLRASKYFAPKEPNDQKPWILYYTTKLYADVIGLSLEDKLARRNQRSKTSSSDDSTDSDSPRHCTRPEFSSRPSDWDSMIFDLDVTLTTESPDSSDSNSVHSESSDQQQFSRNPRGGLAQRNRSRRYRLAELEEKIDTCCTPESGYRSGCSSLQTSPATPQNYT